MATSRYLTVFAAAFSLASTALADYLQYPPQRPARKVPAAAEGSYTIEPSKLRQTIRGIGFEIQSDLIASGNSGLPKAFTSVPHDLTPSERERFAKEMLQGFRYCRLAVAPAIRAHDPKIEIIADSWRLKYIEPVMADPESRKLIDLLVPHHVGSMPTWSPREARSSGNSRIDACRCQAVCARTSLPTPGAPRWTSFGSRCPPHPG